MTKLPLQFYLKEDVAGTARSLLGKILYSNINGQVTAGIISETEAYHEDERACHAYNRRRTRRTEMLFKEGGRSYIYLCYGIHHLFNVVTGPKEVAQAVLVRGVIPYIGISKMLERRGIAKNIPNLTSGPGTLSRALALNKKYNGTDLQGEHIWIEDAGITINDKDYDTTPRIGVDYAGEDAALPWRFMIGKPLKKQLIEKAIYNGMPSL